MKAFDELATLTNPTVPDLSPGVHRLLTLMTDDDVVVPDVAEELQLFPVISARLIGLANSAWSSPVSPVNNVVDACGRLGLDVVKSASIAYAVAAPFNPLRCPTFDPVRFWCCSLLSAEAAALLGVSQGLDRSLSRTTGMLRSIGLIWLADAAPLLTGEALVEAETQGVGELADLIAQKIGVSHIQATVHLLNVWGLSGELRDACAPTNASPLSTVCRIGSRIATSAYLGIDLRDDDPLCAHSSWKEIERITTHIGKMTEKTAVIAKSITA